MQNLIATTFEVVHYIALQAVHYKPLQEAHLSRYNHIYAKMLDRGTFGMPIPGSKDVVTSSIKWEDLLKMVEGIMSDPDSRQARLEGLNNLWKN